MQIISDFTKDTQTEKRVPGSYEWWYFDAMSDEGYTIVIIFYDGNPFSRRYIQSLNNKEEIRAGAFPAISISVYKGANPIFYAFEEFEPEEAEYSADIPVGRAGDNHFSGQLENNKMKYEVTLDQKVANGDRISGTLIFENKHKTFSISDGKDNLNQKSQHQWNMVMPWAEVTGNLEISGYDSHSIKFTGRGYHDHNVGQEPMRQSFKEWYWGRFHIEEDTFLFYLMNVNGNWEKKAWLLTGEQTVSVSEDSVELEDFSFSWFGLHSARKIRCNQKKLNALIQFQERIDNGPFYQRFEGRIILEHDGKIRQGSGISEFIVPSRIYNRLFWPLVNMRITYPGKTHWVQKNPRLYRWTW